MQGFSSMRFSILWSFLQNYFFIESNLIVVKSDLQAPEFVQAHTQCGGVEQV